MMEKFLSQKAYFEKMANDETLPESKRQSAKLKLQIAMDGIRDLKPRIYESLSDLRRMEEQIAAPKGAEENDKDHGQGENGNM